MTMSSATGLDLTTSQGVLGGGRDTPTGVVGSACFGSREGRPLARPGAAIGTVSEVTGSPTRLAQTLFAPLAPGYERWARILSMGQDPRWRRHMVTAIGVGPGDLVLDVAAGTGSITRLLQAEGASVVSLDQSASMLGAAVARRARTSRKRTTRSAISTSSITTFRA